MSYNLLNPTPIIVNQSMASSITSIINETKLQDNVGIQLTWTGAPVGTFSVQISSNYAQDSMGNITNPGTWVNVPVSPPIVAVGAPDVAYIDLTDMSAFYTRLVYTATSGAGTLNGLITGRGV